MYLAPALGRVEQADRAVALAAEHEVTGFIGVVLAVAVGPEVAFRGQYSGSHARSHEKVYGATSAEDCNYLCVTRTGTNCFPLFPSDELTRHWR